MPHKDPAARRANNRAWAAKARAADPERFRAKARRERAANPQRARDHARTWRAKHPGLTAQTERLRLYGLSDPVFKVLLGLQGGVCALCREDFGKRGPFVDHDHATGRMRAILCCKCNAGLGMFNDRPEVMRRAAAYVEKYARLP